MSYLNIRNAPVFNRMPLNRLVRGANFVEPMRLSNGGRVAPVTARTLSDARTCAVALYMGYGVTHPRYADPREQRLYEAVGDNELFELRQPYSTPMLPPPRS